MFDIQLFGDNDTVVASRELKIGFRRTGDYKIEYIAGLENPTLNISAASVESAAQYCVTNGIFLDSGGTDSYTAVGTAYIEEKVTKDLDLS